MTNHYYQVSRSMPDLILKTISIDLTPMPAAIRNMVRPISNALWSFLRLDLGDVYSQKRWWHEIESDKSDDSDDSDESDE